MIVAVGNFTPIKREGYRVGVPDAGYWKEILNTDAKDYGGSGMGNCGGVEADEIEWDGRPYSMHLTLPPSSMSLFRYQIKNPSKEVRAQQRKHKSWNLITDRES